jgi:RNA 3'-terminal phosphate cyclase (ATP)
MIEIDGSQGEGGGQVLRSSLALSILTGQAFNISNIRAQRTKPGLLAQHLKSVDAAAAISRAQVEGAALGSTTLTFEPGEIRSGRYRFDIGTAGSTSLVLQTIFVPLSLASSASTVMITGGTHVPHAPSFHYLERQWLYWMKAAGFDARISMEQAGFYPKGGGRITATIRPADRIVPLTLPGRGPLTMIQGLSAVANLDLSIAERQKRQAVRRLEKNGHPAHIKIENLPAGSKGTTLLLLAEFRPDSKPEGLPERVLSRERPNYQPRACYYALGELGKPAERVADEAVEALESFLESDGEIDQYMADQLLLPLAFASGVSEFRTSQVTQHLLTNTAVIQAFGKARIEVEAEPGQPGCVRVTPANPGDREEH